MNTVFVGCAFGDEGKGKIVDFYAKDYDIVVRYAGGPNAGHTLNVDGEKTILRLIPSGILHPHTTCILGHGMVIDPNVFYEEVKGLERLGLTLEGRLMLSDRAHVILPKHIESDINKNSKIGTTKKGIGPTYEDKISRNGIRVLDIIKNNNYNFKQEVIDNLKRFSKADIPRIINNNIKENKKVMFEGAQGTLLDVDLGTYPFVTSSNATAGGACTGAGVGPTLIDEVIGITKAYVTRVGEGPFPSEIKGELASHLQTVGHEFGSVTGRPRKVGWLDMPLMRYAVEVNGITKLAITKLDVLSGFDKIKVATDYNNDKYPCLDNLPKVIGDNSFTTFPGWKEDITNVKSFNDLPKNAKLFIKYISEELNIDVCLVSVGPGRHQTINDVPSKNNINNVN